MTKLRLGKDRANFTQSNIQCDFSETSDVAPIATFLTKRSPVLHISFSNTNVLFVGGVFVPPE